MRIPRINQWARDAREKTMTTLKAPVVAALLAASTLSSHAADFGPTDIAKAIDTYKQNEIRFKRDYVGRMISFGWTFAGASSRLFGGYRVEFGNGGWGDNVACDVKDQATLDKVVEWNKGQLVTVTGTIDDVSIGDLLLKNCTLQAIPQPQQS
jgi:hypothetical protein